MFSLLNGVYDSYLAPTQLNLLIVGAPESGKTTLLERLKVTEIPTRPRTGTGGNHTVQERIGAEEPSLSLKDALIETGAMEGIRSRRRSSTYSRYSLNSLVSLVGNNGRATPGDAAIPAACKEATIQAMNATTPQTKNIVRTGAGNALVVTEKKSRFSICPAPERYALSAQDQDEVFIDEENEKLLLGGSGGNGNGNENIDNVSNPRKGELQDEFKNDPPRRVRCHSKEFDMDTLDLITEGMDTINLVPNRDDNNPHASMQSIGFNSNNYAHASMRSIGLDNDFPTVHVTHKALQPKSEPLPASITLSLEQGPLLHQTTSEEYHRKPTAKMLPLRLIRPTIGTNLAKIDMYGAKCHIFDVGGKMQNLWERYYDDCDAVIFCWKLGEDPDKPPREPDSDDDSDAEEDDPRETIYKKQQEMLNTVRKSVPDDVPFLILGHVFGNANIEIVDRMYNTDILLPRYHNPMTGFCCLSAKTGAGVQSAMEWLIPLAKRQLRERIASKKELDVMLEEQGKTI
mmetsp:Transcript_17178/g.47290  ORF Transcript_17178/g.47290 Transcript_17178/m.47290 type:complete len:515 (+) Transcript_17178:283-1827(+)